MGTAEYWRLCQADHAPTDGIAIAPMTRRTIVTIEGVVAHEFEELSILLLDRADNLKLLG